MRRGELCPTFLLDRLHALFGILLMQYLPSLPLIYLFGHVFLSLQTHGYLVYTLSYNPIHLSLPCCSNYSSSGHRELFQLAPYLFSVFPPVCIFFLALSYFLTTPPKMLQVHLVCSFPSPRISHFPKGPLYVLSLCVFYICRPSVPTPPPSHPSTAA